MANGCGKVLDGQEDVLRLVSNQRATLRKGPLVTRKQHEERRVVVGWGVSPWVCTCMSVSYNMHVHIHTYTLSYCV